MGRPMARNLARAGLLAGVYNRTREPAEAMARELGVDAHASPSELAIGADIVVTMVADDDASRSLYEGDGGFLETLAAGTVAVEMSTVSVERVRELGELLTSRGCGFLDAPVSGSVAAAETADLAILVGGDQSAFNVAEPALRALGSTILLLGPHGTGATMKLCVNTVVYGLNAAIAEGLVLAERAGISRERAYGVFAASAVAAPFVHYRSDAFLTPDGVPVAFRLDLAKKDLQMILALAAAVGQPMPQTELNARVLGDAALAGFGDDDISAVAEYLRRDGVGG